MDEEEDDEEERVVVGKMTGSEAEKSNFIGFGAAKVDKATVAARSKRALKII